MKTKKKKTASRKRKRKRTRARTRKETRVPDHRVRLPAESAQLLQRICKLEDRTAKAQVIRLILEDGRRRGLVR